MTLVRTLSRLLLSLATLAFLAGGATASDIKGGTAAEAEAMTAKAVAHIKKVGAEKAYSDFTNAPDWKDRDLYVFVNGLNGKNLAHGANSKLVGKDVLELRDPEGKFPNKILDALVKEKGKGWGTEIKFMSPLTQKIERRKVYAEKLGETLVGVGIFMY
jgi:cytochrome c